MEFREAKPEDIEFVRKHLLYPDQPNKEPAERIDYDFVLDHGDYIIGAGGFRLITDTTAWAWIGLTEYVGNHLLPTMRVIREWMEGYTDTNQQRQPGFCEQHQIRRLQAWVPVDFEEGHKIMIHLKFEKESDEPMIDFCGKGKDAWLYVRFFSWST